MERETIPRSFMQGGIIETTRRWRQRRRWIQDVKHNLKIIKIGISTERDINGNIFLRRFKARNRI